MWKRSPLNSRKLFEWANWFKLYLIITFPSDYGVIFCIPFNSFGNLHKLQFVFQYGVWSASSTSPKAVIAFFFKNSKSEYMSAVSCEYGEAFIWKGYRDKSVRKLWLFDCAVSSQIVKHNNAKAKVDVYGKCSNYYFQINFLCSKLP